MLAKLVVGTCLHWLFSGFSGLGAYCLMSWITRGPRFAAALSRGTAGSSMASRSIGWLRGFAGLGVSFAAHLLQDGWL